MEKTHGNTKPRTANTPEYAESFCIRLQTHLTKWMENHTESFSKWNRILLLITFVVITCGYSSYMLINLSDQGKKVFSVTPIRKPAYLTKTGDPKAAILYAFKAECQRIHNFRAYMDSLASSPHGSLAYDSIIHRRPGLMDSVRYIDTYYQKLKNE